MFFSNATGKAALSKAGIGSILRWATGFADLGGIERHQNCIEFVAAQRVCHGGAVVMAGDADEAGNFLFFQFPDGGEHAAGASDALKIVEIAQAVDLNQIDVIGLQELEAGLHRAQRAVAVARVDLGGEKDFLAPRLDELAEPLFAQSFDRAARVGARGIEVVDAGSESPFEQGLRRVFVFDGAETGAGAETDAGDHFTGFAEAAFWQ